MRPEELNVINAAIALIRAQDARGYERAREERARIRLRAAVLALHKQRKVDKDSAAYADVVDLQDVWRRRAR